MYSGCLAFFFWCSDLSRVENCAICNVSSAPQVNSFRFNKLRKAWDADAHKELRVSTRGRTSALWADGSARHESYLGLTEFPWEVGDLGGIILNNIRFFSISQ
jgi:hypothetical protein